MTFSIVAHDPEAQEWGIAVASKFLSVGAFVPYAKATIGAVATQALANPTYGPAGLALMEQGYSAQDALNALIAADEQRAHRQVGLVDREGRSATHTGEDCFSWAGGRAGNGCAAQGNILSGPAVVDRMAESFEAGEGILVDRLLAALQAGQQAGGDSRGQQSAAVLVVKPKGGYLGLNDRYVDLRADDHSRPIDELERLLAMHKLYMFETKPEDVLPIEGDIAAQVQEILRASGDRKASTTGVYDDETREAFRALVGRENLEGRWRETAEVDRIALDFLKERYLSEGK